MNDADRPLGRRYSQLYCSPGEPVYQSQKLQYRVGAYFKDHFVGSATKVRSHIESELGIPMPGGYDHHSVMNFLIGAPNPVFIESITVITESLWQQAQASRYHSEIAKVGEWLKFLRRAFSEENSKFEVDAQGGVHPRIDPVFTLQRVEGIKNLGGSRYHAAREHFETAHAALDEIPPSTNRSIREIFMANEEVFKILCPEATKLEGSDLTKKLAPLIDTIASGAENDALKGMMRATVHYIAASHSFRHAQGQPDIAPASIETAVFMMSSGTALLRWFLWMDSRSQAAT